MRPITPLAVAALAVFAERPMHAYEVFQLLTLRREDRLVKLSAGTLYHSIGRLAEDGLVEEAGTERAGNRPERTVYRITETGRAALAERITQLVSEPRADYPEFTLGLAQAHNLPREQVIALIEQRLERMRAELADGERMIAVVTAKDLPRKYWIDGAYRHHLASAEIAWLDGMLAELRDGSLEWEPRDTTQPL